MNLPPLPPLPDPRFDGFKRGGLLLDDGFDADQLRTYAEQYGRLCAEAAVREERKRVSKAEREEAESSSVEAMWKERQGEDYGSY